MKNLACPHCGDAAPARLMEGPPEVLRCAGCGLVFLAEFPAAAERKGHYQGEYYEEGSGARFLGPFEGLVRLFRTLRFRDILRRLPPEASPGRNAILDVGCGRGLLLEAFERAGWRAVGTQLSETARKAARDRSEATILLGELPELGLEAGSFRVVAFYHVLEHVDRPRAYLEEAHRLLRFDGLLVVEVPDGSAPGVRLLGARNFCLDYPHHLFFFTPEALRRLLRETGFEVLGVRHFSLEYSPFTVLQNLLNLLPGEPNRLYRSFMRNSSGKKLRREPLTWLHFFLGLLLSPAAFLFSLSGLITPLGNTVRIYARRIPVLARAAP